MGRSDTTKAEVLVKNVTGTLSCETSEGEVVIFTSYRGIAKPQCPGKMGSRFNNDDLNMIDQNMP